MATYDGLQMFEINSNDDHVRAKTLVERAEHFDGQKAISDQVFFDASQGKRKFYGFTATDWQEEEAPEIDLVAVGAVGEGEIDLVVDPAARRHGFGEAAFVELMQLAGQGDLKVWVHGDQPGSNTVLARRGFAETRELLRLSCSPARAGAAKARIPEGFRFASFDAKNEAHLKELLEVNALAFQEHPEQGALSADDLTQIMAEDWFQEDDVLLCRHDDSSRLAGFGWIKTTKFLGNPNRNETELYVIAVHPDFGGKGLGTAILEAVFERMATHDPARITLYVEGDNHAALKIYKRAGFTVDTRSHQWSRTS